MEEKVICTNCGIVIHWQPVVVDGKTYCCPGCASGGPCDCDYDNLPLAGCSHPIIVLDKTGGAAQDALSG